MIKCNNVNEFVSAICVLNIYEGFSGQKVNKSKTALFFSKSTSTEMRSTIIGVLGVQEVMQYEKYLGLPSLVRKEKKASFSYIKERVWKELQGWEGKLFSRACREVLIKSVIQVISTCTMSCFKISLELCHEIEALIKKNWWEQRSDCRKVHHLKWEEMTKLKTVRRREKWVLEILLCLMMLSYQNKLGNYCTIKHLFSTRRSKLIFSKHYYYGGS